MCVTLKNEDIWYDVLGHLRCRIRYSPKSIQGAVVLDGTLCNSDGNLNLLGANRNDDGCWLNAYYDNSDNRWNRENGFAFVTLQFSSFLSSLKRGRVLFILNLLKGFGELSVPATKLSAYFVKVQR